MYGCDPCGTGKGAVHVGQAKWVASKVGMIHVEQARVQCMWDRQVG